GEDPSGGSKRVILRLLSGLCALSFAISAATSTAWEVSGFNDFLKGRLSGLSLDPNGRLRPGPGLRWSAPLNQPVLWSLAAGPDGSVYAATGNSGKVFKISPSGTPSIIWSSEQSEVFAICLDAHGGLFAATSPNGGLYHLENSKAEEVWHSPAKYIWALQPAPDGSIYIGTGDNGRVYRYVSPSTTGLYYETGQANITSLALGGNGHLYAGSDPNGLLYDISAPRQARVIYDSNLPEIRAIAIDPSGTIYAAAMGGAVASRTAATGSLPAATSSAVVATTPTVITVTAAKESGQKAEVDADATARTADATKAATSSTSAAPGTSTSGVTEVAGAEKSAIYRIQPDGTTETIRSSKEDNVYALLLDGDALLFSTDDHGRIYRLAGSRTTLIAEPGSGETTQILKSGTSFYAGVSSAARLLSFETAGSGIASYESQVHDASSVARWGHLQWRGSGQGLVFRTRTGFAARPDSTWSSWSDPITGLADSLIKSPPSRFIQFRAEWPTGSSAQIDSINVPYLPQNSPPSIRSIAVSSVVGTSAAKSSAGTSSASAAYSITVTDTGEAPATSSSPSTSQIVSRLQTTQTQISWQADDPDSDKLVYSVFFRAEDETEWQMVRSHMFENTLLLDPDVFADGRYLFKVVASDAPSNAPQFAHQTELVSTPVLIDNTPPVVVVSAPQRSGASADIDLDAHDKTSSLRLCEYSLDAGTWQPIESVDGITDSPDEHFHVHLDKLRTGEHLLVFRVYDTAGNAGLGKVVLR
nr:hypothetical protein [Acidobacteriota bacterium]